MAEIEKIEMFKDTFAKGMEEFLKQECGFLVQPDPEGHLRLWAKSGMLLLSNFIVPSHHVSEFADALRALPDLWGTGDFQAELFACRANGRITVGGGPDGLSIFFEGVSDASLFSWDVPWAALEVIIQAVNEATAILRKQTDALKTVGGKKYDA